MAGRATRSTAKAEAAEALAKAKAEAAANTEAEHATDPPLPELSTPSTPSVQKHRREVALQTKATPAKKETKSSEQAVVNLKSTNLTRT
jgi:hypothetical protein